jgi:hypothetical protein
MAATTTEYLSNPLKMISPGAKALRVNIGTLLALLGIQLLPVLVGGVALLIGSLGRENPIAIAVAVVIGVVAIIAGVIIGLLSAPTLSLILLASVDNQKVALRPTLVRARAFVWRSLGASILTALAVLGGLILFVIPGFIFWAWFSLSSYTLVAEDLRVVASMKRSKELVRGRVWEMWGLSSLPTVASIIPLIGGLINIVLSVVMIPATALRYKQLVTTTPDSRPKVHWSNYALLIGALVAGLLVGILGTNVGGNSDRSDTNSSMYSY